ncbi:MAG: carbohydrate kinase [Treponema sp.]|jgi:fructokinase|nr:carbohydrate kinase [Treponema sp.]
MVISCGEALIDMVKRTLAETGETVYVPCLGGSPFNTAVAVARQKVPVGFLGRISSDFFGESLVNHLIANGVSTEFIARSKENTTLGFVKIEQGREPEYVFYTEGAADRSLQISDLPRPLPETARCIHFGSIAMTMEPAASTIEHFIRQEAGRGEDAPVISLDPNVRPFMIGDRDGYIRRFEGWLALADIAKISEADFGFLYPGSALEESLDRVLGMGPKIALTTLGPGGALGLLRKAGGGVLRVRAPVVDIPVVDTIGAGDTFHGAFLAWLERHGKMSRRKLGTLSEGEFYDALFFANKAASLVCSRQGANPPTFEETEALE